MNAISLQDEGICLSRHTTDFLNQRQVAEADKYDQVIGRHFPAVESTVMKFHLRVIAVGADA